MKRRSVIMIVAIFMLVALIGTGFAAWLITAPTEEGSAEGNIVVEDVTEQVAWQFDAHWVNAEGADVDSAEIVFGAPTQNVSKAWLTSNGVKTENLTVYLSVKANVDSKKGVAVAPNEIAKISLKAIVEEAASGEGTAETVEVDKGDLATYLNNFASVSITVKGDESKTPVTELTAEQLSKGVILQITFGWNYTGKDSEVVTKNPYTYFNEYAYSADISGKASAYLTGLYGLLENCTFKVVLTADVKPAETK